MLPFILLKILILAEVIAGRRSALLCNCSARAIFNRKSPALKNELENLSSPTFFDRSS